MRAKVIHCVCWTTQNNVRHHSCKTKKKLPEKQMTDCYFKHTKHKALGSWYLTGNGKPATLVCIRPTQKTNQDILLTS